MIKDNDSIIVSDLFKDIFKNFNVSDQESKIKQLDINELYYLLICCFDKHDEDDAIVLNNFSKFSKEIDEIHNYFLSDNKHIILDRLNDLTGSNFDTKIDTSCVNLPNVYSREEVRNIKLGNILE